VPGAFEAAKADYVAEIRRRSAILESTFAGTLNEGFRNIYLATIAAGLLAALLLGLYPRRETGPSTTEGAAATAEAAG